MSSNKLHLKAAVKSKMVTFLNINNIGQRVFLKQIGVNPPTWHKLMNGGDVCFTNVARIVRGTNNYFTYSELAELLDDRYFFDEDDDQNAKSLDIDNLPEGDDLMPN